MILIIDGDYNEKVNTGHMVGVLIEEFESSEISGFITADVENIDKYESGAFYKRELKGIESLLNKLNISPGVFPYSIDCIVIDGYASFGDNSHKALGEYVNEKYYIPVIGVAKNKNSICKIENTEIYRGKSKNPLFITCAGCGHSNAKSCIKKMHGNNRLPYAIKLADSLARKNKIQLY